MSAARGVSITADAVAVRVGPCVVYIGWVGGWRGSFTKWAFFLSPTFRVNVKCGLIHWPLNSFNSA